MAYSKKNWWCFNLVNLQIQDFNLVEACKTGSLVYKIYQKGKFNFMIKFSTVQFVCLSIAGWLIVMDIE